ncbi:hypothetical protein LZ554_005649 [Drepanopeziza brunnea f. sp. 'monogermtubi']|nr:hypothetical protein LZ554_005649 [Drepanopeziza brunnea f. sp. 'monogermtubi']
MPTTLPVPSKGALRALRNIALGTSCTIAFGAGMLTEDRRRRIHSAREVHNNAKKLKSARQYHSAGTTSLEDFEDQTLRHREDAFWLPSNVLRSKLRIPVDPQPGEDFRVLETPAAKDHIPALHEVPKHNRPDPVLAAMPPADISPPLGHRALRRLRAQSNRELDLQERQYKLALDITKLMEENATGIGGAASLFVDAFGSGLAVGDSGIHPLLVDAAIKLSGVCQKHSKYEMAQRILDMVLNSGPIAEDDYHQFQPYEIIRTLVKVERGSGLADHVNLRKACKIYLAKFKEKPETMSQHMFSLGKRLCHETCSAGMYDLTQLVFTRLESCRGERPLVAVDHLITATHGRGNHKKMFRYYSTFYTKTNPKRPEFLQVTSLVIDSMLVLKQIDKAEKVLISASRMAENGNMKMSTTWLLRVLGEEWRSNRDMVRAEALFVRLEPLLPLTSHPQALYGAIIQYCVESRDDGRALHYYSKLRESHEPTAGDLRIYGHFALAKAYREDWEGVKEDFHKMKPFRTGDGDDYSAIFTPILKEFSKKHSVSEIEDFIRYFLVEMHLKTTRHIMNIMVDVYSKARELDAISRWINYAIADGCNIDAVTTNIILKNCASTFDYHFEELYALYNKIRELWPQLVDHNTLGLLRSIAFSHCPNQTTATKRLRILKSLDPEQSENSMEVYRALAMTYAKENYVAVLKVYKLAERDHVHLGPNHLSFAVRASLRLHGQDIRETSRFIENAHTRGVDITRAISTVFIDQMSTLYEEGGSSNRERLDELARNTISAYERSGITIPQSVLTHTASLLQKQCRYRESIDFWDTMSRRLQIRPSSFDLPTLTTLLQGYLKLHDIVGIRWVVKMLSANRLTPDTHLMRVLKNSRRSTILHIEATFASSSLLTFLDCVEEALQAFKRIREDAMVNRKEARTKLINIMETAIEDQALRGASQVAPSLKEAAGETLEGQVSHDANGCGKESVWLDPDTGSAEDANLPHEKGSVALGR